MRRLGLFEKRATARLASPMTDMELRLLARGFRARAEEILTRAETFHDAWARQKMLGIAWIYEKLAERLEKESTGADEA
jgi:hypothetical protein